MVFSSSLISTDQARVLSAPTKLRLATTPRAHRRDKPTNQTPACRVMEEAERREGGNGQDRGTCGRRSGGGRRPCRRSSSPPHSPPPAAASRPRLHPHRRRGASRSTSSPPLRFPMPPPHPPRDRDGRRAPQRPMRPADPYAAMLRRRRRIW